MAYNARAVGASASEFAALVLPLMGTVRKLVGVGGDPELADELAQQTFLEAYESRHTFDTSRPPWPWLYRIAKRVYWRWANERPRKRPVRAVDVRSAIDERADPIRQLIANQGTFLWAVRPRYRRLLILKYLMGLRYAEIAQLEGLSLRNVQALLERARVALKRAQERAQAQAHLILWLPLRGLVTRARERSARTHRVVQEAAAYAATLASAVTVAGVALTLTLSVHAVDRSAIPAVAVTIHAPAHEAGVTRESQSVHNATSRPVGLAPDASGDPALRVGYATPIGGADAKAWIDNDGHHRRTLGSRLDGKLPKQFEQTPTYAESEDEVYCDAGITFATACAIADAVPDSRAGQD